MNASMVSRTLALIPERVSRQQTGSSFDPAAGGGPHPERIAHLAHFLEWLGPLREVTKDDLRVFGLLTAYGKPAIAAAEDDEPESEPEALPGLPPDSLPREADETRLEDTIA